MILTRMFSISTGNHFAFLVISVALLGYGASGTFLWLFPKPDGKNIKDFLSEISLVMAISVTAVHILINRIPFDPAIMSRDTRQIYYLTGSLILVSSVFFLSGLIIASAFSHLTLDPGKIYFADMAGAGGGCLLPLLLLTLLRPEKIVLIYSLTALFASIIFAGRIGKRHVAVFAPLLIIFVLNPAFMNIRISPYREMMTALRYEDAKTTYTAYNSHSRIDVIESPAIRFAPGLSIKYKDQLPDQKGITIDGGNLSALIFPDPVKLDFVNYLPSSLVYFLNKGIENVLIMEPGGGLDILTGLLKGAKSVDALYENSLLSRYVSGFYRRNTVIDFDGVNFLPGRGRDFLNDVTDRYDLVILPVTNPLGASSGFSSGEDYFFTKEAFEKYYLTLKKDGYLCYTGYLNAVHTVEARVFNTFLNTAMAFEGTHPNLIAIRSMNTMTIILKKGKYTEGEILALKEFTKERNFDICFYPKMKAEEANIYNKYPRPIYYDIFNQLTENTEEFIREYMFDISVVTDDSPFFNNYFPVKKLSSILKDKKVRLTMLLEGGYMTPLIAVVCLFLSFFMILFPVIIKKKTKQKPGFELLFFILIGLGYMAAEIVFVHKFMVLFGNPVYSVSIVLLFMLISSGAGSMYSSERIKNDRIGLFAALFCAGAILLLYSRINPFIIGQIQRYPLFIRTLLAGLYISPLGFIMGIPFPTGIRIMKKQRDPIVPLMFCANSQAGVVSSSLSLVLASMTGYTAAMFISGILYVMAFAISIVSFKD